MKISEVVEQYMILRDEAAQLKKARDEVKQKMEVLEAKLLKGFEKLGVDSAKTPFGTAYTTHRTSVTVADKEVFMKFVRAEGEWELMEARAAKLAVEHYVEMHGNLPPGLSMTEEVVVNVRQ